MRDLLRMLFETELRLLRSRLLRTWRRVPRPYVSPHALERSRLRQIERQEDANRRRRVIEWRDEKLKRPTRVTRGSVAFGVSLILHGVLAIVLLPHLFPGQPAVDDPPPLEISISFVGPPKKPDPEPQPPVPPSPSETPEVVEEIIPVEELEQKVEDPEPVDNDRPKVESAEPSEQKPSSTDTAAVYGHLSGGPASSGLGSRGGDDHLQAVRLYGGTAATEQAVQDGLAWLAAHQDEDGSWSVDEFHRHCRGSRCRGQGLRGYRVGASALAVLAFLGVGIDGTSPHPYRRTVAKGLAFLKGQQDGDGCLSPRTENYLYNHSIATLCLAEAAILTQDIEISQAVVRALHFSEKAQQPGGGWDYTAVRTLRNDLSVTGWQVMAIRMAKQAGIPVDPVVERNLERFIQRAVRPSGVAVYADRPPESGRTGIAMVAVGLLSKLYLGWPPASDELARAADLLIRERPDPGARSDWRRSFQGTYYWYYATLALFHMGGEHWDAWNTYLTREVLPLQKQIGHEKGSWDPDPNWVGSVGGRVTATALSVLIFEVYYRYDPLHRQYGQRSRERGAANQR